MSPKVASTGSLGISLNMFLLLLILGCTGLPLASLSFTFAPGTTYRFAYKTDTSLNDLAAAVGGGQSRLHKRDVGVRLDAVVEATSLWSSQPSQHLVKLAVKEVTIQGLAKDDLAKKVDTLLKSPAFFLWDRGLVSKVITSEELRLSGNIYKGMISLFQVQSATQTAEETDSSGTCDVAYERKDEHKLVKSKKNCSGNRGSTDSVEQLLGATTRSWFHVEYSFADDFILSVKSQESHESGLVLGPAAPPSFFVATRQQMSLLEKKPSKEKEIFGNLEEVIERVKNGPKRLAESTLATSYDGTQCSSGDCTKLSKLVKILKGNITAKAIGRRKSAASFLELVRAFRTASKQEVAKVLEKYKGDDSIFLSLIDVAVAAQTKEAWEAVTSTLNFRKEAQVDRLERFLLSSALSTYPSKELLEYLQDLSQHKFTDKRLRESVLLSLGATVHTYKLSENHDENAVKNVEDDLLKQLAGCQGDASAVASCQSTVVRALSNAGIPSTAEVLAGLAETSKAADVGEACLKALRRFDKKLINEKLQHRLKDIFHQRRRGYDTVVRSQALKLLLQLELDENEVKDIFFESLDPWNTDYSLFIQSRLSDEARKNQKMREYLKTILKDVDVNNYHVLAPRGKSLAFSSQLHDSPRIDYLMYVENSRSGTLKRSGMDVDLSHLNLTLPLYKFELFAAGLSALIGDSEIKDDEEKADVTAGMSLDMMGVSLRPITFFVGQGGLMSAIWNAPSELVSALQINFLLQDHFEVIALGNGLSVEVKVTGAVSLDLSGSLSVSLWNKNAHSLIRNSGAVALSSSASLRTGMFRVSVENLRDFETGIDFKTDVDFYDGVKMCLQMQRPVSLFREEILKREWLKHHGKSYMGRASRVLTSPGISYPLPKSNYDKCRILFPTKD